jgi:hypothetical protein
MPTDYERLVEANNRLARRYDESDVVRRWLWIKFRDFRRFRFGFPPWHIASKYETDHMVFDHARRVLKELRQKSNKHKVAYFTSLKEHTILSADQLRNIDPSVSLTITSRLEVFFALYDLELELAQGLLPYVELSDELDSTIERFQFEGGAVLPMVEELSRKRQRRDIHAFTSGGFALFVLIAYVLSTQVDLVAWVGKLLIITLIFIFLFVIPAMIAIWRNFPPILQSPPAQ